MKNNTIKIKKTKNKKSYLDESYGIIMHYKQLINNPEKKILPYIKERIYLMIAIIIWLILWITLFHVDPIINWFIIGIVLMAIIINLKTVISATNYITERSKEDSDSELIIDDKKVILKNNHNHITYECDWEKIKYILISKNSISFLPINKEVGFLISIPIDYKEECYKLIEAYNKQNLIRENNNKKRKSND